MSRIICGIDPGANTGLAAVQYHPTTDRYFLIASQVIKTKPKDAMELRIAQVFSGVSTFISERKPMVIVIEGMRRFAVARSSVKSTVIQSMFHGAVLSAVAASKPPDASVSVVSPPKARWAGRGKTLVVGHPTKGMAHLLCQRLFGKSVAEHLTEHEKDAIALCVSYKPTQKEV